MKPRPLTYHQQRILDQCPKNGAWVEIPVTSKNAEIRGLISRGLIEHKRKDPDSIHEWIVEGLIRRVTGKPAPKPPTRKYGYEVRIQINRFGYDPKIGSAERDVTTFNVDSLHGDWSLGDYDKLADADNAISKMVHVEGDCRCKH